MVDTCCGFCNSIEMTQVDRIFAKFGGAKYLQQALELIGVTKNMTTIYRWNLAKPRGSGGIVPSSAVPLVERAALAVGVDLTDQDWSPKKS